MSNNTVDGQFERLRRLEADREYKVRRCREWAEQIAADVSKITEEDIAKYSALLPDIAAVSKFSAEDILADKFHEADRAVALANELLQITEKRLKFFEDKIWST